jgi:hypothetical protein
MRRVIWRHRQKVQICNALILAQWLNFGYLQSSYADIDAGEFTGSLGLQSAARDYFSDWFMRIDETQAVQPHWITPLLTELYRYDQYWEHLSNGGGNLKVFGAGKGLELIPAKTIQLILGVPPYEQRTGKNAAQGIGDYNADDRTIFQQPRIHRRHYHRANEDSPHELWNNPWLPVTY